MPKRRKLTVIDEKLYVDGNRIPFEEPVIEAILKQGIIVAVTRVPVRRGNMVGIDLEGRLLWRAKEIPYGGRIRKLDPANPYVGVGIEKRRLYAVTAVGYRAYVNHKTGAVRLFGYTK
jgi:hypothetical protein